MSASPLLALPGAVPALAPDEGVAWHYGDPLAEQRRLEAGAGAVDLSHHGVVRVTGDARLGWLNDLTSQEMRHLRPGQSTEALILDPNGRIEHALHVIDDGASTWLLTGPAAEGNGSAAGLTAYLMRMRFWTEVEITDVTADWATVWEPTPTAHETLLSWHPAQGHPMPGREVLVARGELVTYAGAAPAGVWAHEAIRTAAGVARPGLDTDDRTIPHELGWLCTAVALDKGCYRGQETVARVHNLGKPPRRLTILHLDGSAEAQPRTGDSVTHEGREVGRLGSVAQHAELGPVALALVKRSVPEDAVLEAGGAAAAQEVPALLAAAPSGGAGRAARAGLHPHG